jgi:aminoglycoside 6-adenylyltransferase
LARASCRFSSSRTNPNLQYLIDRLSDYDIDVIIRADARAWYEDRGWLVEEFGKVLVGFMDPPALEYGIETFGGVIIYESGVKIDYTIMPVGIFAQVVAEPKLRDGWDDGHRVLLDKDGMAVGMPKPTNQEYIPKPPSAEAYRSVIDYFFTDTIYVAKNLLRDELIFMKSNLDQGMKAEYLLRMLEWRMEIDHNWSVRLGLLGRGLKKRLPPELWAELEKTYTGAETEENWAALFRTIALFRQVAVEVGERLGYAYPYDLEKRVIDYLNWIKSLVLAGAAEWPR